MFTEIENITYIGLSLLFPYCKLSRGPGNVDKLQWLSLLLLIS